MALINVPTTFAVYVVANKETGELKLVKECKTKGEAVQWIYQQGTSEMTYCIQEHFRKR